MKKRNDVESWANYGAKEINSRTKSANWTSVRCWTAVIRRLITRQKPNRRHWTVRTIINLILRPTKVRTVLVRTNLSPSSSPSFSSSRVWLSLRLRNELVSRAKRIRRPLHRQIRSRTRQRLYRTHRPAPREVRARRKNHTRTANRKRRKPAEVPRENELVRIIG